MNQHLQKILNTINEDKNLSEEAKNALIKSLKDADKEFEITSFKLDRTEKVKRTTAILLEETIDELEQKRKAVEAQNRELEIETSLERVRTVAMSMNKPDDMLDVCKTIALQLQLLGVKEIRNVQTAIFYQALGTYMNYEYYAKHDKTFITETNYTNHEVATAFAEQMFKGKGEVYTTHIKGSEVKDWLAYQRSTNVFIDTYLENATSLSYYWHSLGPVALGISTYAPLSDDALQLLQRFLKVFDLSYRRYLDIEKAIAQAKEAQIETSLERVRAQAIAMRKPEDLTVICEILFAELHSLGFSELRNAMINIFDDDKVSFLNYDYSENAGKTITNIFYNTHPVIEKQVQQARTAADAFSEAIFAGKDLADWKLFRKKAGELADPKVDNIDALFYYFYSIGTGVIGISTYSAITEEKRNILKRFRNVFDFAYRRYIDVANAEAQAREAQIETGLERVRSRSMAMHNTAELQEVIHTVHKELLHLNIAINGGSFIAINSDIQTQLRCWGSGGTADTSEEVLLPLYEKPFCSNLINGIKNGTGFFTEEYTQEEKKEFFSFLFQYEPWSNLDAKQQDEILLSPGGYTRSCSISQHTSIFIINHFGEKFSAADNDILKRFGKVFEQTYTRFLDLQKAEEQTRAAQIELAVERVRAKALAMHNSTQILDVVVTLRNEMLGLEIPGVVAATIYLQQEEGYIRMWDLSSVVEEADGFHVALDVKFKLDETDPGFYVRRVWNNPENYFIEKQDAADMAITIAWLRQYYPQQADEVQQFIDTSPWQYLLHPTIQLEHGKMSVDIMDTQPPAAMESILQKMGAAFDLAYKRFIDLQKSEAQIKEAQIELALERVRAKTLSMQRSDELANTAAVLFQQLIALGIEPNRLYISIVKDEKGASEFWITDEDGTKISTAFTANLNDNISFAKMFEGWKQQKKSLVIDMQGEELQHYFQHLASLGVPFKEGLTQKRRLQDIAYFSKGFIGMASPDEQPVETLQLLERFAAVFNLTFTRFNDLKVAEAHAVQAKEDLIKLQAEKKRAEDALGELRATQTQLIQSEKMASLGELTAGIAHEIQNPLNFVNNFSEVSKELLDEMREAIEKGDPEEAKEIMHDVIQNLEKINHHGKRADAIVKGMLQHSRSSSGAKEPTNINTLADEYLRLAYHGLRAKDKSFNVTLETAYDDAIGNINIIPQDMGRVILNLITNAFYVVNEKALSAVNNERSRSTPTAAKYEPTVSVSTKRAGDKVLIKVTDNGNGIPQNIIDKIFQPFFTTKPTGQGTGLGLSLAYDIIKAHNGELAVESSEGNGTVFTILLKATT